MLLFNNYTAFLIVVYKLKYLIETKIFSNFLVLVGTKVSGMIQEICVFTM